MKKNILLPIVSIVILLFSSVQAIGQDIKYVRKQLDQLCSPEFQGRGYYNRGDRIAAEHIAKELEKHGVKSFGQGYMQEYSFNVNSLEKVSIKINGKELLFGDDYMMNASSGSAKGKFTPLIVDASLMQNPTRFAMAYKNAGKMPLVVLDSTGLNNPELFRYVKTMFTSGVFNISGLIEVYSKTPGSRVGRRELQWPYFQVNMKAVPENIHNIEIDVKNKYYENYPTQNVIGYIPGEHEQVIVYTAHYDGMGSFGEGNYFPGASDNASGTSMVLDLARHYSTVEKPYYTTAFMLFSGEEAGLMGSKHYADNPVFPLEDIKLVVNLDMVGTGQTGVLLFNAPKRPVEAAIVQKINEENNYMKEIIHRDAKANSDHWPFHVKSVPAIFFLTTGKSGGGHNIFDTAETLPLYAYENFFKLVLQINKELERQEIN